MQDGYEEDASADVMLTFCLDAPVPEAAIVAVRVYGGDGIDYNWLIVTWKKNVTCAGYKVPPGHYRARVHSMDNRKDRDQSRRPVEIAREYLVEGDVVAGQDKKVRIRYLSETGN